jgi:hypothetical protein
MAARTFPLAEVIVILPISVHSVYSVVSNSFEVPLQVSNLWKPSFHPRGLAMNHSP